MKISFENFKNQSKLYSEEKLFCLIAGVRGAGKSTTIGTLNLPTLLIASSLESHAIEAAQLFGAQNITSTLYDVDDKNKQLRADAALANLHEILDFLINSEDLLNNIKVVALDSISAIDKTLLETTRILGEKNGFERPKLVEQEHLKIIRKLKELHRRGLHVLATMPILATYNEDGFYTSVKPEITGITTTSSISGIFPEVLVVGRADNQHVFQMNLVIKKTGKDTSGADKQIIFHPRITGLSHQDLLEAAGEDLLLPADLDYIYRLKQAKKGK